MAACTKSSTPPPPWLPMPSRKPNETTRLIVMTFLGVVFGFLIGLSFPILSLSKLNITSSLFPTIDLPYMDDKKLSYTKDNFTQATNLNGTSKIWVPSNPRGAEILPPGIIAAESDFYSRRLWGNPNEDLTVAPRYLVAFTVGYDQRANIDACVKKFSEDFTIVLFHYDGKVTEWDQFEWSKQAIHVSARKQTKWWYAKRFLHPKIVAPYDYIFIWDEDLGVEHFNAEVKHGLEISQPGLEPDKGLTWQMTKRRGDLEVHKFVEIMAPVFSRDAWRSVWHMIQNDLVHGWGLDFALRKCVEPAHEKIGVVDSQWIVHQTVPSLGNQVKERCRKEWTVFRTQMTDAENAYFRATGIDSSSSKL